MGLKMPSLVRRNTDGNVELLRNWRPGSWRKGLLVRLGPDMDLARPDGLDNRPMEIVADGLPLFLGAQLAVDTTLASVLRGDGAPRSQCANEDGAALVAARRRKEATYLELDRSPCSLLVSGPQLWQEVTDAIWGFKPPAASAQTDENRAAAACRRVQMGEVTRAPRNDATLPGDAIKTPSASSEGHTKGSVEVPSGRSSSTGPENF